MSKINYYYCFINEELIYITDSVERSIKNLTIEEKKSNNNDSNIFKPDEGFRYLGEGIYMVEKEIFPNKTKISNYLEDKKGFLYSENLQKEIEKFSKKSKECESISIQLSGSMTKEEIREALGFSQEDKKFEEIVDYIYNELNKDNEKRI